MKKTFLIFFLSLMITGIGSNDIYAKSKKVSRPKTKSTIKKKEPAKIVKPKKRSTVPNKDLDRPSSPSVIKRKKEIPVKTAKPNEKDKKTNLNRPTSSSVIKKKDKKTDTKLTPIQKNAVDKKLAKHTALKGKKFKSKKEAEDAYRKSLASQKYDTKPQQKPDHIPEYYEHNGRRIQTEFYNGSYGYYESPGIFRSYNTNDFIVDMLVINALTTPRSTHVVSSPRRETNENDVKITVIILIFFLIIIGAGIGIFFFLKKQGS